MLRLQIELPENISNMEVDCIKKKIEDVTGYEVDVVEVTEVARVDKQRFVKLVGRRIQDDL